MEEKAVEIKSAAGNFCVLISGTQEEPTIKAESFLAGGKVKVQGKATLQHWTKKGLKEGLHFDIGTGIYIQCPEGIDKIRAEIAKLSHKIYWARKIPVTIDSDGYKINTTRWEVDGICQTEKGTLISEGHLTNFLDKKGIVEIIKSDAMKLWAEENEESYIKINEEGNKRAKALFEDDESEVGYWQACENAGIPKFLR